MVYRRRYRRKRLGRTGVRAARQFLRFGKKGGRTYVVPTIRRPRMTIPLGIKDPLMIRLRYVENVTLNPGVNTTANHLFRCNSVFDPNYTGTGHQPLYFDTYTALFNHYIVLGSRITVNLSSGGNQQAEPAGQWGIYLNDDTTAITGTAAASQIQEQKKGVWSFLNMYSRDNARPASRLSLNFSTKKFFGIRDVKDNKFSLGASVTTNPTDEAYFTIWYNHPDVALDPATAYANVVIEYIVQFSELKEIAQS